MMGNEGYIVHYHRCTQMDCLGEEELTVMQDKADGPKQRTESGDKGGETEDIQKNQVRNKWDCNMSGPSPSLQLIIAFKCCVLGSSLASCSGLFPVRLFRFWRDEKR
ncbi:hypothetical protein AWENTII_007079 [Aspergillus wentii]